MKLALAGCGVALLVAALPAAAAPNRCASQAAAKHAAATLVTHDEQAVSLTTREIRNTTLRVDELENYLKHAQIFYDQEYRQLAIAQAHRACAHNGPHCADKAARIALIQGRIVAQTALLNQLNADLAAAQAAYDAAVQAHADAAAALQQAQAALVAAKAALAACESAAG